MFSKKITKFQSSINNIYKVKANNSLSIHVIKLSLKKSEFYYN